MDWNNVKAAQVQIDPTKNEVSGYTINEGSLCSRFGGCKVYFSAVFKDSFVNYATWNNGIINRQNKIDNGTAIGAVIQVNNPQNTVEFLVAISFIR